MMRGNEVERIIIGVAAFVISGFFAYTFAFVIGAIFLPEVALAGLLGFLGGLGGGYFTRAGRREALLVGFLGGLLGAVPVAVMEPYNPVPGGVSVWLRFLKALAFVAAGSIGGLAGRHMRMNPSPPGWWGPPGPLG